MIEQFKNEYRWLSNFAPVSIEIEGITYPSVEHAYMAQKSLDKYWKEFCSDPTNTAGKVKRASKNITLREDWEDVKVAVMLVCLEQKFSQEPYKSLLLETGSQHIQEGNTWGDTFWGVCLKTGEGKNMLGELIMMIRNAICFEDVYK